MKKVIITIENGDSFELMVDGEVEKITVSTNVGDYEVIKNSKSTNSYDRKRKLRKMMNDTFWY